MRNGKLTKKPTAQKRKAPKGKRRKQKGKGMASAALMAGKAVAPALKFLAPVVLGQLLSSGIEALGKKKKGSGQRRKRQTAGGLRLLGRK